MIERIGDSVWFKIVGGVVFVLGIHLQNTVEISEVKGAVRQEIVETRLEMMKDFEEKYVSKDYLKLIVDDIKEIKFILKGRK